MNEGRTSLNCVCSFHKASNATLGEVLRVLGYHRSARWCRQSLAYDCETRAVSVRGQDFSPSC